MRSLVLALLLVGLAGIAGRPLAAAEKPPRTSGQPDRAAEEARRRAASAARHRAEDAQRRAAEEARRRAAEEARRRAEAEARRRAEEARRQAAAVAARQRAAEEAARKRAAQPTPKPAPRPKEVGKPLVVANSRPPLRGQTLQTPGGTETPRQGGGFPPAGKALEARAKGLREALGLLDNLGLAFRARQELAQRKGEIDKLMPARGGVLVVMRTQEKRLDQVRHREVLSVTVAGAGATPEEALQRYRATSWVGPAPLPGYRAADEYLIWIRAREKAP